MCVIVCNTLSVYSGRPRPVFSNQYAVFLLKLKSKHNLSLFYLSYVHSSAAYVTVVKPLYKITVPALCKLLLLQGIKKESQN